MVSSDTRDTIGQKTAPKTKGGLRCRVMSWGLFLSIVPLLILAWAINVHQTQRAQKQNHTHQTLCRTHLRDALGGLLVQLHAGLAPGTPAKNGRNVDAEQLPHAAVKLGRVRQLFRDGLELAAVLHLVGQETDALGAAAVDVAQHYQQSVCVRVGGGGC